MISLNFRRHFSRGPALSLAGVAFSGTTIAATTIWSMPASCRQQTRDFQVLLISDVDHTITGDAEALKHFNDAWRHHLRGEGKGSSLVYNTARPKGPGQTGDGFEDLCDSKKYPIMRPDAIICSEGTEVYWFDDGDSDEDVQRAGKLDQAWDRLMASRWDGQRVASVLDPYDQHIYQCPGGGDFNSDDKYRHAITVSTSEAATRVKEKAVEQLGDAYTVNAMQGWMPGMWLVTVMPIHASKLKAADFVRQKLSFETCQCVWAGDSDNDIPMLGADFCGIVVGNATSKQLRTAASRTDLDRVYQSDASFAAGLLEGLRHFGFME